MNFNPELSSSAAIMMSLFAAFLWGTWFISLKYMGDYPLDGFYLTLFTTSVTFVWTVGILLDGSSLFRNISEVGRDDPSRIWVTLLCGMLYVFGMRISLYVLKRIGLSLTQPIQSSVNILAGTGIAAVVGGVPVGLTPLRLLLACIFLLGAMALSVVAGNIRANSLRVNDPTSDLNYSSTDLWKAIGLLLLSSAFVPAYTFGLSYGLRSVTHSQGLAVLPFMALLASGAFLASLLTSGLLLTINKQWGIVLHTPFSIAKFGIMSGLFHYGGNIIHTFATAYLSSAVSWPLGVTSGLWTQVWGLVYGEFKGAPRRAYLALFSGIGLYLIGAYIITYR